MDFLFVMAAAMAAFFAVGCALQALGVLEDPACECPHCTTARHRDITRGY